MNVYAVRLLRSPGSTPEHSEVLQGIIPWLITHGWSRKSPNYASREKLSQRLSRLSVALWWRDRRKRHGNCCWLPFESGLQKLDQSSNSVARAKKYALSSPIDYTWESQPAEFIKGVVSLVFRFWSLPWTNRPNTQPKSKLRYSPIQCSLLRALGNALFRPSTQQNHPRDRKLTQSCWCLHWFLG